jgi:type VI secretion system protein ImpC
VGLLLPRFLARAPYREARAFRYEERAAAAADHVWASAAFAFATCVAGSFALYRWCPNIIGPTTGGAVPGLPTLPHGATLGVTSRIATEVLLGERLEYELAEEGFIPFSFQAELDQGCFFSASSTQKARDFGPSAEGRAAALSYRLGAQLPYLFVVGRIAHYLKVIQREQIGTAKERRELEAELNAWIGQYVVEMDVTTPEVRARRPLRQAQVFVSESAGSAGWYKVEIKLRPHFKYMGAAFELSLVGKLEKD